MESREGLAAKQDELPLALLDPPCDFRAAAMTALERVGRSYRIAATSATLAGLRAAVLGGIAVTVRTARWMDERIGKAPRSLGLPELPETEFSIRLRSDAGAVAADLAQLLCDALAIPKPRGRD